jgi:MFS family permease
LAVFLQSRSFIQVSSIVASVIGGFGSALIWVAQGSYFSRCATDDTKGMYFGFFWSIYSCSQIFGNLLGAVMFQSRLTKTELHLTMTAVSIVGVVIFAFVKRPFIHRTYRPRNVDLRSSNYLDESEYGGVTGSRISQTSSVLKSQKSNKKLANIQNFLEGSKPNVSKSNAKPNSEMLDASAEQKEQFLAYNGNKLDQEAENENAPLRDPRTVKK